MAITTSFYHTYKLYAGASSAGIAQINHDADTFKLVLLASADTFNNDHSVQSQLTTEISAANYTAGGITLANVTYTLSSSGTAVFDADDVVVTASGTDMSARAAVVVKSVASADRSPLLFLIDFDGVKQADDGSTFNIQWSADGIVLLT